MTNQDLTNIKETIEWLLENGDFKDAETSYNSAMNSIDTLEKAILVTRCSTQLKDKEVLTFDEWLEFHYDKTDNPKVYRIERDLFNKEDLYKTYNKHYKKNL